MPYPQMDKDLFSYRHCCVEEPTGSVREGVLSFISKDLYEVTK